MNPSLSVLLPLHNAEPIVEPLLLEAIEILPDLTGRFDIAIIDDGSTDDTTGVANAIAARYPQIRVLRHARRLGLLAASRTGIAATAGELVLWRDESSIQGIRGIHRLWRELPGQAMTCGCLEPREAAARVDGISPQTITIPMPELYLARREVIESLPWPIADRGSLEREMGLRGFRWTEIALPTQLVGSSRLPGVDPMFRQLADQSKRIAGMFNTSSDVHGAEGQRAPNFLGKLRKFALGE